MSGGSFNYLYGIENLAELGDNHSGPSLDDLQAMAEFLAGLGWADAAAGETREWLELAEREIPKRLRDVWHAMEWWRSCDYGEDQARAEVQRYDETAAERRAAALDRAAEAARQAMYPKWVSGRFDDLPEETRAVWRAVAKAVRDAG
jgi:hypothetical protein